jgi:hypothetical protein
MCAIGPAFGDYRASVQLSANPRPLVLYGRPRRSRGHARPFAWVPFNVTCAAPAGTSTVQTP